MENSQRPAALLDESQPAKAVAPGDVHPRSQNKAQVPHGLQQPHPKQREDHAGEAHKTAGVAVDTRDHWRQLQQGQLHSQQHPADARGAADAVQRAPAPPTVQYQDATRPVAAAVAEHQQHAADTAVQQRTSPLPPAHLQKPTGGPVPPAAPAAAPAGAELEQHVRDLVSSVVNRATEPQEKAPGLAPTVTRKPTLPLPGTAAGPSAAPVAPSVGPADRPSEDSHLLALAQRGFVDFCELISHPERWDTALAKRAWRQVAPILAAAARVLYQVLIFVAVWAAAVLVYASRIARPAIAAQWRRRRANSARLRAVEARFSLWAAKLRAAAAPHNPKLDSAVAAAKKANAGARRAVDDFYVATVVPASHRYHLGTSLETARAASPTSAHAPGVVDALVERAQVAHDAACAGLVAAVAWTGRASRDAAVRYERCSRQLDRTIAWAKQRAATRNPAEPALADERKTE